MAFGRFVVSAAAAETNGGFIFRIQIRILVFLTCVAGACPKAPVEASELPSDLSDLFVGFSCGGFKSFVGFFVGFSCGGFWGRIFCRIFLRRIFGF